MQLRLEQPLVPAAGDRFVLRQVAPPDTLGGGTVVDPRPRKHGPGKEHARRLRAIASGDPLEALRLELEGARSGVGPEAGEELLAQLEQAGEATVAGGAPRRWFTPAAMADARRDLLHALASAAAGPGALARMAGLEVPAVSAVLADLLTEGVVRERDGVFAVGATQPTLDDPLARRLAEAVRADGTAPRAPDALAAAVGVDRAAAVRALDSLAAEGVLVRLRPGVYLDPEALEAARRAVVAACELDGSITIAQLRDSLGTSRKHAQAILEHLDARRITRRRGDEHVLRSGALVSRSMRMRQSMAQLEREFEEQAVLERRSREQLRRGAIKRTRVRRRAKIERGQQLRFLLLIASIVLTIVVVTVAMFETLAWLMG